MAAISATPHAAAPPVRAALDLPALLPISAAILLGAALGPSHPDSWRIVLIFAVAAAALALLARSGIAWAGVVALLALALGLWRAAPPPLHGVQWPTSPVEAVRGTVTSWPVAHGELVRTTVQIEAARTVHGWDAARATVRALLP